MVPVIALIGRPNVGKSTLFNRLTRSRDALVANLPGLTRDRQYGEATVDGKRWLVIDTGGITGEEEGIDAAMAKQSLQALEECDIALLMVDARDGVTATDRQLAARLRETGKRALLVVNKVDGLDPEVASAEFFELGLSSLFPIAASHGRGVKQLMAAARELLGAPEETEAAVEGDEQATGGGLKIAVIGRPNVGKSTLVNRMLGEERVVVFDQPGTTRDSIHIHYERFGKHFTLIDTAGVRRRKNVAETVEKFSIVKTLQAVEEANVVITLIDAREGLVDQDLHLLGFAIEAGRALVLAVNKWDGLDPERKSWIREDLKRRLRFADYAEVHYISALHGTGVGHLYDAVEAAYESATRKLSTPALTRLLEQAVVGHAPPMVRGRRVKLRYAHAGGQNPPVIVIHGNQVEAVPESYRRYLEHFFRDRLELSGTPVMIEFRGHENPYAGRRNTLTPRQQRKRDRLKKHVARSPGGKRR